MLDTRMQICLVLTGSCAPREQAHVRPEHMHVTNELHENPWSPPDSRVPPECQEVVSGSPGLMRESGFLQSKFKHGWDYMLGIQSRIHLSTINERGLRNILNTAYYSSLNNKLVFAFRMNLLSIHHNHNQCVYQFISFATLWETSPSLIKNSRR